MLELQHVSVEFASEHSVLAVDDISMQLEKGTRTAIVGETGSGKSVLLLAILRLLPPNAKVRGSILLNGEELLEANRKRMYEIRGGEISYIPQGGGASMNPLMRVGDQVGGLWLQWVFPLEHKLCWQMNRRRGLMSAGLRL